MLPESLPPDQRSPVSWGRMNPFGSLRRLRAYPLVAGIAVVFIFASLAQRGLENVWVLHAGYRYGWDAQANGLTLALVGVMAALVQGLLVRPIVARLGERRAILFGIGVSMLAFLGYGLASAGWVVLVIIVLGSVAGVAHPTIQGLVAGAVPPSEQGKIQGALTSLISLTAIAAPLVFTAGLFSYFTSDRAPDPPAGGAVPPRRGPVRGVAGPPRAAVPAAAGAGGRPRASRVAGPAPVDEATAVAADRA